MPVVATTIPELQAARARLTGSVGLVPTMGALHEGHLSLMRRAGAEADTVAVSIFVNPLQFGPGEDLDKYPRMLEADLRACDDVGVGLVFAPTPAIMYPHEPTVTVSPGRMGTLLEGAHRPGHFDGMLTVVLKLFNLVRPDIAVFGQKDGQQLALIRRMVADLNVPVRVLAGETVREPDGLALSSRNRYLTPADRDAAVALSRALFAARDTADSGPEAAMAAAEKELSTAPDVRLDYLSLVAPDTFQPIAADHSGAAILAVAAHVGATRLIDNVTVTFP
ncbi:MAG TPA: pantoate--beta-alanine ligase [Streptosporangiaceae bacterium]|jgi:pantoate--beta-alanine ligase